MSFDSHFTRRDFLAASSGALVATSLASETASAAAPTSQLALHGGQKAVADPLPRLVRWGEPERERLNALIDQDTLEFEMNVDGFVSSGGLGGPAILPLSLAKMSEMTRAFPEQSFSGIGGISTFRDALNYFLLGCGTVQVCTAAMLDKAVGPNVIKGLIADATAFFEKNADRGFRGFADILGLRRDRIVPHSQIKRPDDSDYQGGYEPQEGYADPVKA